MEDAPIPFEAESVIPEEAILEQQFEREKINIGAKLRQIYIEAATEGIRPTDLKPENIADNFVVEEENIIQAACEQDSDITKKKTPNGPFYKKADYEIELWHSGAPISPKHPEITLFETVTASELKSRNLDNVFCGALVRIESEQTGEFLNLHDLLPYGYKLNPTSIDPLSDKPVPLESYKGSSQNNNHHMILWGTRKTLAYGDLSKDIGLLGTLHEVAHAWQLESYPDKEDVTDIQSISDTVNTVLKAQEELNRMRTEGDTYVPSEEFDAVLTHLHISRDLKAVENFLMMEIGMRKDRLKREDGIEFQDDRVIPITDPDIIDAAKEWVWRERQAWASAIKVFRELKDCGLTPENTDSAIWRKDWEHALGSYQSRLEQLGIHLDKEFV